MGGDGSRIEPDTLRLQRSCTKAAGESEFDADNQRQALQFRDDWIRISDLLNPIQAVAVGKVARAGGFSAYASHTSYILRA
jgi:hypothetical protein